MINFIGFDQCKKYTHGNYGDYKNKNCSTHFWFFYVDVAVWYLMRVVINWWSLMSMTMGDLIRSIDLVLLFFWHCYYCYCCCYYFCYYCCLVVYCCYFVVVVRLIVSYLKWGWLNVAIADISSSSSINRKAVIPVAQLRFKSILSRCTDSLTAPMQRFY